MVRDLLKHLTCFEMIRDGPVDLPRKDRLDNGGTTEVAEMPKDKMVSEFTDTCAASGLRCTAWRSALMRHEYTML